jgi:hypothetical protein
MKVVLILSVICLLFACKNASQHAYVQKDTTPVLNTPVDSQSRYFAQTANLIGLGLPAENDSFVLRLWISSMVKPDQVIELRRSESGWVTKKFLYYFEADGRPMFKKAPVKPSNTLDDVVASLRQTDLRQFISQEQIEGFQDNVADGVTYNMEIFKSGHYQRLSYHCPETYYSKEVFNRRFVDLLMVLDKHFTFYSPICKRG